MVIHCKRPFTASSLLLNLHTKGRSKGGDYASAEGRGEEPERVSHTSSPTIMAVTDANGQKSYPCR